MENPLNVTNGLKLSIEASKLCENGSNSEWPVLARLSKRAV